MWNTALHDLPLFADNLAKWLPTIDARYITLVKGRFAISGRYVISVSLNHIDRLVSKSYTPGTFRAPFLVKPGDLVDTKKGLLTIPAAEGDSVKKGESAVPRYYDNPELLDTIDEEMANHPDAPEIDLDEYMSISRLGWTSNRRVSKLPHNSFETAR